MWCNEQNRREQWPHKGEYRLTCAKNLHVLSFIIVRKIKINEYSSLIHTDYISSRQQFIVNIKFSGAKENGLERACQTAGFYNGVWNTCGGMEKAPEWGGKKQINIQLRERKAKGGKKNDRHDVHWKHYFLLKNCSFLLKFRNYEFWDHI